MVIAFDYNEGIGEIYIIDGRIAILDIRRGSNLRMELKLLKKKLEMESRFRHNGIPGKKATNDPKDEVLKLLNFRKKFYDIRNIKVFEKNEDAFDYNITDIDEVRFVRMMEKNRSLREFEDRYEYCLIRDYEEKYPNFSCDSIQLGSTFVQILDYNKKRFIVSIDFPKDRFTKRDIVEWINKNEVKYIDDDEENFLYDCSKILDAIAFNKKPVILYEKGKEIVHLDRSQLVEITQSYSPIPQKVDTSASKEVTSLCGKQTIIYDGQEIDYIPRIEIDICNGDFIVSNGHILVADYIDDYSGNIGFYSNYDTSLPIAWLHDSNTTTYIDIYEREKQKIVVVEAKYIINIEDLFDS